MIAFLIFFIGPIVKVSTLVEPKTDEDNVSLDLQFDKFSHILFYLFSKFKFK